VDTYRGVGNFCQDSVGVKALCEQTNKQTKGCGGKFHVTLAS